ncbi:MAG: ATP-binding protein, partial [Acidobacteriota bacterium]
GGIAHDFNNLLTGILGSAGLARLQLADDHDAQVDLERVEATARRAADLCRQMLAYAGRRGAADDPVDLAELVCEITDLMRVSVHHNTAIEQRTMTAAGDARRAVVLGDPTQLRQIVMNLVLNASDAIGSEPGGRIDITVEVVDVDDAALTAYDLVSGGPGAYVRLAVRDNGCGMSETVRNQIFEPFFSTKDTGHGLGLAAVLGIVRAHRGALRVESELDHGSLFQLLFPCDDAMPHRDDS